MESKIKEILERMFNDAKDGAFTEKGFTYKTVDEWLDDNKEDVVTLGLPSVSKCYSKKDMDNAYDKGFNDGVGSNVIK